MHDRGARRPRRDRGRHVHGPADREGHVPLHGPRARGRGAPVGWRAWADPRSRARRPSRVPLLAGVLARSFADDPMITLAVPRPSRRRARGAVVRGDPRASTSGPTSCGRPGTAAGVAVWIPPGSDVGTRADERRHCETRSPRSPTTAASGTTPSGAGSSHTCPPSRTGCSTWWGSIPRGRARGSGARSIGHGLDLAERDDVPAFLETGNARNVPYYERFGFRVIDEGDAPGGGPHIWFMRT